MGKLVGYDYEITYKPGTANAAADALSRRPDSPCLNATFTPNTDLWKTLRAATTTDPFLQQVSRLADAAPGKPYHRRNGLVCFKNRVVIPPGSSLIATLLHEFHNTLVGDHSGALRTFKRLAHVFYWPSMQNCPRICCSLRHISES